MNKKQHLLDEFLKVPIAVGDDVLVKFTYEKTTTVKEKGKFVSKVEPATYSGGGEVLEVLDNGFVVKLNDNSKSIGQYNVDIKTYGDYKTYLFPKEMVFKSTFYVGVDPFINKDWGSNIRYTNVTLDSLIYKSGFEKNKYTFNNTKLGDVLVPEICWTPTIIDVDGNEVQYQRDFVWGLMEKQLLIDSIYNQIDIGKIILRKRSYEWVEKRIKEGKIENTAFYDIVDGKQRYKTILDFIENKFTDSYGNYYNDLSDYAKRKFFNFNSFSFGEIGESVTDKDIQTIFLNVNFSGVPMSQEHIDFVKSLNI